MAFEIIDIPLPPDKKKELAGYLCDKFEASVKARRNQLDDKYKRWMDNYSAKPFEDVRTTPFYRASNFVPQLIRMHTDIAAARVYGILMACKPFWNPTTLVDPLDHQILEELSSWLDFKTFQHLMFQDTLDSLIFRAFKTGTVLIKAPWTTHSYSIGTAPTEEGASYGTKDIEEEGLEIKCIPYEDFWLWPITVNNEQEAEIVFHRIRLTKEGVQHRANSGRWDKIASVKLLETPDTSSSTSSARESQAQEAGLTITPDVDRPFSAIEAWFQYDLGQGKELRIIIVFNPFVREAAGVLKAYFNYYEKEKHCFVGIRPMPREDLAYGYSLPEILEQSQEEQAQIHNARRDSNLIANMPGWKKRKYAEVPNPATEWYPGKVFELEDMDDLQPLTFPTTYNSLIEEENFLLQLSERYSGISPPMQGYGAGTLQGKRGIYSSMGTMAMLAEGNRRIDVYIRRMRTPFHRLGNLIYQSYKGFQPEGQEFQALGERGQNIKKTFKFKEPDGFKGYFFEIGASTASANKEVDRTNLLLMSNTMAGYYRQIVEAAQGAAQLPKGHPLQELIFQVLDGAKDLADRLLFYFDIGDRKKLIPDIRKVFGGRPPASADSSNIDRMSQASGPVSNEQLADLSSRITAIAGANSAQTGVQ